MKRTLLFVFCLYILPAIACANNIDSLESLLKTDKADKYEIYCKLSSALWEIDSERSKKYAGQAVELAKRQGDERKMYKAMRNYGMIHSLSRDYDSALKVYSDVLKYFADNQDTTEVAALHRNIGDVYYRQSKLEEALKEYLKSEHLFQQYFINREEKNLKVEENYGATLNNIGNVYLRLNDLEKSVSFFEQALEIQKKTGDKYSEAAAYTNIGNIYHYLQKYDKCLEYYHSALKCADEVENYSLVANISQNIATTYQNQKQINKAKKYYDKSLDLFRKTDNNDGLMEIFHSIALLYATEKNRDSTNHYFDLAENMANEVEDYQYLSFIQKDRAEYYKSIDKHEEAYNYLQQSQISQDSVLTIDARKQINELTVKYESEKKDNLLRIKNLEMQQQKNELYMMYLALAIVSVVLVFIILRYRNKHKVLQIIKEKNEVIKQANLELEQQNEYIIKQNSELSNLNSMKDKFFSIISHDMRNPITNLSLLVDISEAYCAKEEYDKLPEKFRKFRLSLNNLMSLFENLLIWAKTQTGAMKFNKSKQNITVLLSALAESFELTSEVKNIKFEYEAKKNIMLDVDKDMIEFISRNILSNAFKFTNHGGIVKLSVDEDDDHVYISVKDDGIGLSQENIEKMFMIHQKYSRVGTANEKGSGLGLTIVKEFVDMHHGTISVESKEGEGSEFIIKLPKN